MEAAREKLNVLTSLRFFAATLVFLFHYGGTVAATGPFWVQGLTKHGHSAVTFFFVLSGFILSYTYLSRDGGTGLKGTRTSFWAARFSRVYPLYCVALLISLPMYVYGTFRGRNPATDSLMGLLFVPVMLQAWLPPAAIEWSPPAWSLSVEAFFYAVFPALARLTTRKSPKSLLGYSFALICVTTMVSEALWPSALKHASAQSFNLRNFLLYFPLLHLPSFLTGMAVGRYYLVSKQNETARGTVGTVLFPVIITLLVAMFALRTKLPGFLYSPPILVLLFSIAIYSGAMTNKGLGTILALPILTLLGDSSYAMYILQAPLSAWYESLLKLVFHIRDWTQSLSLVLLFFIILVVLSVVSFEFVEKPLRGKTRKWFEGIWSVPPSTLPAMAAATMENLARGDNDR